MTSRYERHIFTGGSGGGPPPPPEDVPIRDAHVIVVAQDGYLATLSSVASPPMPANNLNLAAGSGDQVGITCDYLDAGDGAQLQLALAAALAGGLPIDIRLRPCNITLTQATVGANGLAVPAGCRLIGAGANLCVLRGTDGTGTTTQTVVTLGSNATVEDVTIISPAPTVTPAAASRAVVVAGSGGRVLHCNVAAARSTTINRNQVCGYSCASPSGAELVFDCGFFIDPLWDQPAPVESVAIEFGSAASPSFVDVDSEVNSVRIAEFTSAIGSCPVGVRFLNVEGGYVVDVEHHVSRRPSSLGAISWLWGHVPGAPVARLLRGPRVVSSWITSFDDESSDQTGFAVFIGGGALDLANGVSNGSFTDCWVRFTRAANQNPGITKRGFSMSNSAPDGSPMFDFSFTACKVFEANQGFFIDTTGGNSVITSIRLSGCQARGAVDGNSPAPRGAILRGLGQQGSALRNVGLVNCDFSGAEDATGVGVEIQDASVFDTVLVANNLTPAGGGSAFVDNGTGSQIGLNVL